jgi:galactose mutarotase-like enzyme
MFTVHDASRGSLATVVLADDASGSRLTVAPSRGALAVSFHACGREWLYMDEKTLQDPSKNVRGGIPVLFPSPGRLDEDRFQRAGAAGALKQHGFARTSVFREVARGTEGSAWVELELVDDEATREAFPFPFRLGLTLRLMTGWTMLLRAAVRNTGTAELPFALGYHPYFAVPMADKAACRIPTRATRAWDNVTRREMALERIDLSSGEVDLHLLDHDSSGATLEMPQGTVDLGGHLRRWVIWTLPGEDFVCLEPWSAPANALNTGEDLTALAPGEERAFETLIAVRPRPEAPG